MAAQEHRRVSNQSAGPLDFAAWDQMRRTLLSLIAQFKASDPHGCYTLEVRVVPRNPTPAATTDLTAARH